jgi:hypothetical protein
MFVYGNFNPTDALRLKNANWIFWGGAALPSMEM